jgi:hypothetical protein
MAQSTRRRPRTFNTAFESGLRSVVILTAAYPRTVGLHRLVALDHLIVHTGDIDGPPSLHPKEESRAAEILVRRKLVDSGLALMGTRCLLRRIATPAGFRYQAGEEAGAFIDLLSSRYMQEMKLRARWLSESVVDLSDGEFDALIQSRFEPWQPDFQSTGGTAM